MEKEGAQELCKFILLSYYSCAVPALLRSIYLKAQSKVFKSQGRLKQIKGIFLLTCGRQKHDIFNIPSLGILIMS